MDCDISNGSDRVKCYVYYYHDDVLVDYQPIETWNLADIHMLDLNYALTEQEAGQHTWKVYLEAEGGNIHIDAGDASITLHGQGLITSESWDGIIEIAEEYAGIFTGGAEFGYEDSGIVFDWKYKDTISITESYDFSGIGGAVFSYTDSVTAYTENIIYELVDADHTVNVGSSDGSYYIQSSS